MNTTLRGLAAIGLIMLVSSGVSAACPNMPGKTYSGEWLPSETGRAYTECNGKQAGISVSHSLPGAAVQAESAVKNTASKAASAEGGQAAFNMDALIERLKKTQAIGFFTKIAIRNDVMDFSNLVREYRKKSMLDAKIKDVRARFEGLFLKIVALLEKDPDLSRYLYLSREDIWKNLLEDKT